MITYGRYGALIAWMLTLLAVTAFVVAVRGPVREAAWSEPCAALARGEAIPGAWKTTEPCRGVRP